LLLASDPANALVSERFAKLLGYERVDPTPSPARGPEKPVEQLAGGTPLNLDPIGPPVVEIVARPLEPARFWYPAEFSLIEGPPRPSSVTLPSSLPNWPTTPVRRPVLRQLAPWRELQPRLRALLGASLLTAEPDIEAILRAVSRGHQPDPLPVLRRRRWGARLRIVVDRSQRLTPFYADQDLVVRALETLVPGGRLDIAMTLDADPLADVLQAAQPGREGAKLVPGAVVLVLGDLGTLALGEPGMAQRWAELGRRLAIAGCRAAALLPGPLTNCPAGLRHHWQVLPWERSAVGGARSDAARMARSERLLRLCAPAVRLEPGLLRAIRRLLPPGEADAGTEADAWQSGALSGRSPLGASFHDQAAARLRAEFEAEARAAAETQDKAALALLGRILATIRAWRQGSGIGFEVWAEEVVNLGPHARALLPDGADVAHALDLFALLDKEPQVTGVDPRQIESWLRRVAMRATEAAKGHRVVEMALLNATRATPGLYTPSGQRPPHEIPTSDPERALVLLQAGQALCIVNEQDVPSHGSPVARLTTANGLLRASPGPPRRCGWNQDGR